VVAWVQSSAPLHLDRRRQRDNVKKYLATKPEVQPSEDAMLFDESFSDLYGTTLPEWLLERCRLCGWERPTRIQARALDAILLDKKDAIIQAETGSGKTLSYLLPAMAFIDASRSSIQVLIVVPTRELGLQVGRVAKQLAAASISTNQQPEKIMVMNVLQGSQNRRQRAWAWAEPPHLVIGTPQELCDMVRFGGLKRYNSVKYVVVDEVDACLLNNAGSMTTQLSSSTLHELLSKYLSPTYDDGTSASIDGGIRDLAKKDAQQHSRPMSERRQTVFASATIPQHRHFLKQCMQNQWTLREPVHICLRPGEQLLPGTLDHAYLVSASSDKKLSALRRIIKRIAVSAIDGQEKSSDLSITNKKVLIFCDAHRPVQEMAISLSKSLEQSLVWRETCEAEDEFGKSAVLSVLRFEDSLSQRAAAMDAFRGDHRQVDHSDCDNSNQQRPAMRVMLASGDLGARGLDIDDVTHVIHFDLPPDADTYVHRAGRTGRFQKSGNVLSIVTPEQEFVLRRLANKLSIPLKCLGRQQRSRVEHNLSFLHAYS